MYTSLPRTQAHCSGFESDWYFGSALGIIRKAKRKTRLADYDFKMAESNLWKTRGKEKESFRVFFSKGKEPQLFLKGKIPCPQISCEKDPQFFERNGISQHFRVIHKCTFMDLNLQESLALRRRLHAKETTVIPNEFFKVEAKRWDEFLCLCDTISPQNSATRTVHTPNPEIGILWAEIEPFHAKRSHGPLRDLLDGSCSRVLHFLTLETPRQYASTIPNGRLLDLPCRPGIYLPRKVNLKPDLSLVRDKFSVRYEC